MIATYSPRPMSRSTSLSAAIEPSPDGNSRHTPRSEMSGCDIGLQALRAGPASTRLSPRPNAGRRRPDRRPPSPERISHRTLSSRPTWTTRRVVGSVGVDRLDRARAVGVGRRQRRRRDRHDALRLAEHDAHLRGHVGAQHAVGIGDLEAAVIVDRRRGRRTRRRRGRRGRARSSRSPSRSGSNSAPGRATPASLPTAVAARREW